jgi:F-box-like
MSGDPPRPMSLMRLPTELHLHIASYLSYPDALALKHTSRHFYAVVPTGVHLKVDWLIERFERSLECPMEQCSFRTDESFCNWRIRRIMKRRRRHLECRAVTGGCFVVEGRTCCRYLIPTWLEGKAQRGHLERWLAWAIEGQCLSGDAQGVSLLGPLLESGIGKSLQILNSADHRLTLHPLYDSVHDLVELVVRVEGKAPETSRR